MVNDKNLKKRRQLLGAMLKVTDIFWWSRYYENFSRIGL